MVEFDMVYGVDFSAAKRDAGRNTWIAKCTPTDGQLAVDYLADAANSAGCDPDRDSTLDYLVHLITESTDERRAFGLDFPFGLPVSLLDGDDWSSFVAGTPERWGALDGIEGPTSLYESARDWSEEYGEPLHRETDRNRDGQAPTGFRIKTQTYYGVSKLLSGLDDDVSVAPMEEPTEDTVFIETYPRAVFDRLDEELDGHVHDTGYKRDTRESIQRRRENVEALRKRGVEFDAHSEFAVASHDALDAVAAVYATWSATSTGAPCNLAENEEGDTGHYEIEGYIYC